MVTVLTGFRFIGSEYAADCSADRSRCGSCAVEENPQCCEEKNRFFVGGRSGGSTGSGAAAVPGGRSGGSTGKGNRAKLERPKLVVERIPVFSVLLVVFLFAFALDALDLEANQHMLSAVPFLWDGLWFFPSWFL